MMLKKPWIILLSLATFCISLSVYLILYKSKSAFVVSITSIISIFFLAISILLIQNKKTSTLKKIKYTFLTISLSLLAMGILSKFIRLRGGNIEILLGVLSYCFLYAPLELNYKNEKWRNYSNNKWEILLLSTIDFIGVNLILIGILATELTWIGHNYIIYIGSTLLLIGLISWNSKFKQEVIRRKESEDKIKIQYEEIEKEKEISDKLLLNILPEEIAKELKVKGSADTKLYDEVTVLFADFKDFTKISEEMSAKDLVDEINTCFMYFDTITEKYGIEKIKTIGDCYMCAGGLPVANETHAVDIVNAAIEMQKFIANRYIERTKIGKEAFQIRIGIHTGPVVAGIVGIKKFAYDIWGDTVNTASRMESSGETGKINISSTTYELIKNYYPCTPRGKISIKNKAEMDMYFVEAH